MQSAISIGREIKQGTLDPVELVEAIFDKIKNSPHAEEIFSATCFERAMEAAKATKKRQQTGTLLSPLDGVPISWKDLFDSKDIPTEAGSPLLADRVPDEDCKVLKRASAAGLICIGKTHLSELAFSGLGINPNAETPPNIHDKELAPGGSSSGAAASVAYDFVPIGIGSDTGGSVRIPAAWNNLVGLKTTAGYLPTDGVVLLCKGFDTVGPLSTCVEDAWLMTAIMAGEAPQLPQAKPLSECKFLINQTIALDELDDEIAEGFNQAMKQLEKAGATLIYQEVDLFNEILPLGPILFPYEAWQQWGQEITQNPGTIFKPVENRFLSGKDISEDQYKNAWKTMIVLRESYYILTQGYDGVLAPTVPIKPPNVSELMSDVERFQKVNMLALRNTRFGNMFGVCALTLPTSTPSCGLMIMANPFTEKQLTSVGLSIEKVLDKYSPKN